jgi:hypothetical protein
VSSYGARIPIGGANVGVIDGRDGPRLSADSTAIWFGDGAAVRQSCQAKCAALKRFQSGTASSYLAISFSSTASC